MRRSTTQVTPTEMSQKFHTARRPVSSVANVQSARSPAEEGEAELGTAMLQFSNVGENNNLCRSDPYLSDISVTLEAKRMVEPVALTLGKMCHACMYADNKKLRVPAIASVTICGTLRANNFRKRWYQPLFRPRKMVIALLTFCKILCNRSPTLKASDRSLNRQKEPNNSNCPARCYN